MSVGGDWDFPLPSPVPQVHLLNWFLRRYLKCQFVGLGISQAWQLISRGGRAVSLTSLPVLPPRPLSTSALPNPASPLEPDCSPADLIQTPQTSGSSRSQITSSGPRPDSCLQSCWPSVCSCWVCSPKWHLPAVNKVAQDRGTWAAGRRGLAGNSDQGRMGWWPVFRGGIRTGPQSSDLGSVIVLFSFRER